MAPCSPLPALGAIYRTDTLRGTSLVGPCLRQMFFDSYQNPITPTASRQRTLFFFFLSQLYGHWSVACCRNIVVIIVTMIISRMVKVATSALLHTSKGGVAALMQ